MTDEQHIELIARAHFFLYFLEKRDDVVLGRLRVHELGRKLDFLGEVENVVFGDSRVR